MGKIFSKNNILFSATNILMIATIFYFVDKICSPEEIEKKRLLALQKRQQAQLKAQSTPNNSSTQQQSKLNDNKNIMRQNKSNNRFNPIEPRNFFNQTLSVTGKCYMISNDRFALETSSFVPEIIEIFKTVPSRIYGKYKLIVMHTNIYDFINT